MFVRKTEYKNWMFIFFIVGFCISVVIQYSYGIPPVPKENMYVQDYANLLSREVKEDMLIMSQALKDRTSAELVVVTVPSLEGKAIEAYALDLFRGWGIGNQEKNNGVLLLIAQGEREARIEVGYGLEGAINDGKAGAILDRMISYFQRGDYNGGIATAYSLLLQEMAKEYSIEGNEIFQGSKAVAPVPLSSFPSLTAILGVLGAFMTVFFIAMLWFWRITRRNPFRLLRILGKDLLDGKYAEPMQGPFIGGGHIPPAMGKRHHRGPFGGGSFGPRSGRGGFGGGSSGGGGASRKW